MTESDIEIHYMVTKKVNTKVVVSEVINLIYAYVQNKEVYFKYEPHFHEGVLIFCIVGFQSDHKELQKLLGKDINKFKCELEILQE